MSKKKTNGVGATCSVLLRYLHPAKAIAERYCNYGHKDRLDGLLVIGKDKRVVNKVKRTVVTFLHDDFEELPLFCCPKFAKVEKEGPEDQFFEAAASNVTTDSAADNRGNDDDKVEIPPLVFHATSRAEDIHMVRGMGFYVDDDNEPAEENIPAEAVADKTEEAATWEWDGVCDRQANNHHNNNPSLRGVNNFNIATMTYGSMFILLFPMRFVQQVMLVQMNMNAEGIAEITYGEFLRYLGLWFFMATCSGFSRAEFFSTTEINCRTGAPYRLNCWMSANRFKQITEALSYTNHPKPTFVDRFWEIRQLVDEWQKHIQNVFKCSWVACLDESMSIWNNKWTCPGWMFVPRKPNPFGNKWHSICCGLCCIVFDVELREGKDAPKERVHLIQKGTTGLLLRLTKALHYTGKVVVLDSGFCVLETIIALKKMGVFAAAVIKNRRYWPKYVPGDEIDKRMKDDEVGQNRVMSSHLNGERYSFFMMKEPAFVMKMMTSYGDLQAVENQEVTRRYFKDNNGNIVRRNITYTTVFANHFRYRHAIDDHNNQRHSQPAFEDTWKTTRWENRVFAFLLAITEINAYNAFRFFYWTTALFDSKTPPTIHHFRRQLALDLIYNDYLKVETQDTSRSSRKRKRDHNFFAAPPHGCAFICGKWDNSAKQKYQQFTCKQEGCKRKVRTYCSCAPAQWMCQPCFAAHIVDVATSEESAN